MIVNFDVDTKEVMIIEIGMIIKNDNDKVVISNITNHDNNNSNSICSNSDDNESMYLIL